MQSQERENLMVGIVYRCWVDRDGLFHSSNEGMGCGPSDMETVSRGVKDTLERLTNNSAQALLDNPDCLMLDCYFKVIFTRWSPRRPNG